MSRDAARGRLPTLPPAQPPGSQTRENHLTQPVCCQLFLIPSNPAPSSERNYCIFPKYWGGGGPKSLFPFSAPLFSFLSFLKLDQLYRIPNSMHLGGLFFLVLFKLISLSSTFSVKSNDRGLAGFRFKAGGKVTVDP